MPTTILKVQTVAIRQSNAVAEIAEVQKMVSKQPPQCLSLTATFRQPEVAEVEEALPNQLHLLPDVLHK